MEIGYTHTHSDGDKYKHTHTVMGDRIHNIQSSGLNHSVAAVQVIFKCDMYLNKALCVQAKYVQG